MAKFAEPDALNVAAKAMKARVAKRIMARTNFPKMQKMTPKVFPRRFKRYNLMQQDSSGASPRGYKLRGL